MHSPSGNSNAAQNLGPHFALARVSHPIFWLAVLLIGIIFIRNALTGELGQIGQDDDDVMRLVQVRDFLSGQSWFHTDQIRLGPAGGTDMHWSRIPDIPVLVLTAFFDLFMAQQTALKWAYSFWPPFTAGILIYALTTAARFWGGAKTLFFTLVLLSYFVLIFLRFEPGSIDHHNLQLGLLAVFMAFALDPSLCGRSFFISGLAVALSVAIGADVYVFAAITSLYVAINWVILGDSARSGTLRFCLGLSGGLALAFLGTVSPAEYGRIYCDALSLITLCAGVAGGVGLALAAKYLSSKSWQWRLTGMVSAGALCLFVFALQAPQCLANPLDSLPDDVGAFWLGTVREAQPLLSPGTELMTSVPMFIGAPLVAIVVMLYALMRRPVWSPKCLVAMLLFAAIALTFYQVRFQPYAYIIALVPLAAWTAEIFVAGRQKNGGGVLYIACLAASISIFWGIPGLWFSDTSRLEARLESAERVKTCFSDSVMAALNALPNGRISASSNGAPAILMNTGHAVLSGNYHRNWQGIAAQIRIATSEPSVAYQTLSDHNVDYLLYCKWDWELSRAPETVPAGLLTAIDRDEAPDYLELISDNLEGGDVKIFKVLPSVTR
jgi:hypothetical protein